MNVAVRTLRRWSSFAFAAVCLVSSARATSLQVSFKAAQSVIPSSSLSYPFRVAVDSSGNVYISNTQANEVLKETWSPSSQTYIESVVVSTGLATPYGIAVDASGNVYIADNGNNRVVKESPSAGSYTQTVVSTTTAVSYPTGIAVDSSGNLYIADTGGNRILKEAPSGSGYTETALTYSGHFGQIAGIAVDSSGDIFVSDIGNAAVYEETYSAGSYTPSVVPTSGLSYPYDVAVDASGNLFIADYGNTRIVEEAFVSAGSYTQSVFPTAYLRGPLGIAVDAGGNLYIADTFAFSIKKETLTGGNFNAVPGGSASGALSLLFNFTGGNVGDTLGLTAIETLTGGVSGLDFASSGSGSGICSITAAYSAGDSCFVNVTLTPQYPGPRYGAVELFGSTTVAEVSRPNGVQPEDSSGSLLATVYLTGLGVGPQVNFLPFSFSSVSEVATAASPYSLNDPADAAVDAGGNVYVVDYGNNAVYKETLSAGAYTQSTVASGLDAPQAVALDGAGSVYIADSGSNRILKETWQDGSWAQTTVASGLDVPAGVAVDGKGDVYFTSYRDGSLYRLTLSSGSYSTPVMVVAGLNLPTKIALDGSGDIFIADTGNSRVVEETPSGDGYAQTVVGSGMQSPYGVAVGASGIVYVADTSNERILQETPAGAGFTQTVLIPGPPAYGIAVDGQGNVYFPDPAEVTVFKVGFSDPPSFSFASTVIGHTSSDSPQSATIENVGNAALTLPPPESGSNPAIPAGFKLDASTTCPEIAASASAGTLAVNATCVYAIDFAPAAASTYSGSAVLTDNDLNQSSATQSIALSGTGLDVLGSFLLSGLPASSVAGASGSFTLTAKDTQGATMTSYTGTVRLSSSDAQAVFSSTAGGAAIASYTFQSADAGVKTLYVTFKTAGSQTATATDAAAEVTATSATDLVTAAAAAAISTPGPAALTTTIGAFLGALEVTVADAYGNPVSGVTVNYAAPSSGASAVLSATSAQTTSAGTSSVAAYANAIAGGPYTITASVAGLAGSPVSFTGNNLPDSTSTALATAPGSAAAYGASVTLTATVTPAAPSAPEVVRSAARANPRATLGGKAAPAGSFNGPPAVGPPTGTVSFYDTVGSSTRLLGAAMIGGAPGNSPDSAQPQPQGESTPPVAGTAIFSIAAPAGGQHSYTASYGADANFTASTSSAAPYTVTRVPAAVAGPAMQPVLILVDQAGAIPVTVTGPNSGPGIAQPTGSVGYTVKNAAGATVSSGTATLAAAAAGSVGSIPTPGTLAPGAYSLEVSYLGDGNYTASSAPVAISFEVGKITTAIEWPQPAAIVYGTSLSGVLNATAKAGSATVAGTFAYTATPAGGEASAVTAATVLGAGSYTLAVAFTPTDGATYATATGSVELTVGKAAASIALVSSANPQYVQDPVSFTATVASSAGVPPGSVAFYDGATALGTVALASGVAVYTTSSLALGSHSITGVYSGNANFASTTSAAVSETVQDFNLTISTSSGASTSATASPGGTATYPLVFTPVDGSTFPQAVNLTVSGLPAGATATLTPATLAAGSGTTPVTLTVQLANTASAARRTHPFGANRLALALGLILLPFAARLRPVLRRLRARDGSPGWIVPVLLAVCAMAAGLGLAGCGGKPTGYFGQTPETYTLTITGTSGALSHSTTVTLTVE